MLPGSSDLDFPGSLPAQVVQKDYLELKAEPFVLGGVHLSSPEAVDRTRPPRQLETM